MTPPRSLRAIGLAGLVLAGAAAARGGAPPETAAYAAMRGAGDTLRVRLAARTGETRVRPVRPALGASVAGYLSPLGLPPVAGVLVVTDSGLAFRSMDGGYRATLPMVVPVQRSRDGTWGAPAVSLAYVDEAIGRRTYLFRVNGGVFETDAPDALLEVAAHPSWLDSLRSRGGTADRALVDAGDDAAARALLGVVMNGAYADSLYAVFGRPSRPAGIVGTRGRAAGRLGEFIANRDSLALDPEHMTSVAQLRHTLAHELAHRWQARAGAQLALLWQGVPAIRDPRRYGYGNVGEHQAEAAAFAMHFLLATGATGDPARDADALDHYELLVPGTRTLARYFALQPAFARHPLRAMLTAGRTR